MKIYYIWDAYCGWSYGFNKIAAEFLKRHPELEVEMISGGLFIGEHQKSLFHYPQAKQMNQQIADLYGVLFSEEYDRYFEDEQFRMNSQGPARVFGLLRTKVPRLLWGQLGYEIQKLFYQQGLDLNKRDTYRSLLEQYDLDQTLLVEIQTLLSQPDSLHEDFVKSYRLGVHSYPTMLLEKENQFYHLNRSIDSLDALESRFNQIVQQGV